MSDIDSLIDDLPFHGEVMICSLCSKTHKSDPNVASGWTTFTTTDARIYVCPVCFDLVFSEPWKRVKK